MCEGTLAWDFLSRMDLLRRCGGGSSRLVKMHRDCAFFIWNTGHAYKTQVKSLECVYCFGFVQFQVINTGIFYSLLSAYIPSRSVFSKLPSWARAVVPRIFYVTEKAWNYYPYTVTGTKGLNCWNIFYIPYNPWEHANWTIPNWEMTDGSLKFLHGFIPHALVSSHGPNIR